MDVNILVHSPYVVVPENGTLTEYVHAVQIIAHYAHMLTTVIIHTLSKRGWGENMEGGDRLLFRQWPFNKLPPPPTPPHAHFKYSREHYTSLIQIYITVLFISLTDPLLCYCWI